MGDIANLLIFPIYRVVDNNDDYQADELNAKQGPKYGIGFYMSKMVHEEAISMASVHIERHFGDDVISRLLT